MQTLIDGKFSHTANARLHHLDWPWPPCPELDYCISLLRTYFSVLSEGFSSCWSGLHNSSDPFDMFHYIDTSQICRGTTLSVVVGMIENTSLPVPLHQDKISSRNPSTYYMLHTDWSLLHGLMAFVNWRVVDFFLNERVAVVHSSFHYTLRNPFSFTSCQCLLREIYYQAHNLMRMKIKDQ